MLDSADVMTRKAAISIIAILVMGMVIVWFWFPITAWVEMTKAVLAIRLTNSEKPIGSQRIYTAVNTEADGCSIKALREYYDSAARALYAKSPKTVTYTWADDVFYYSRVSTILETPRGYIEVVASHNNDNNRVIVIFSEEPFSHKGRDKIEKLENRSLPERFFPQSSSAR